MVNASNGWLYSFSKRHNIVFHVICGKLPTFPRDHRWLEAANSSDHRWLQGRWHIQLRRDGTVLACIAWQYISNQWSRVQGKETVEGTCDLSAVLQCNRDRFMQILLFLQHDILLCTAPVHHMSTTIWQASSVHMSSFFQKFSDINKLHINTTRRSWKQRNTLINDSSCFFINHWFVSLSTVPNSER